MISIQSEASKYVSINDVRVTTYEREQVLVAMPSVDYPWHKEIVTTVKEKIPDVPCDESNECRDL